MFKKILCVISVLFFSAYAFAQTPEQVVRTVIDEVLSTLKTEKAAIKTDSNRLVRIVEEIIIPHTDIEQTSKGVLAKHWRDLTPAQQKAFEKQFEQLLIRTYAVSFRAYENQEIVILETRYNPSNANRAEVRTVIKEPGKPNLPVNYRFLKEPDGSWKVYDINVDNVSLVSSFRTQIGDAITRDGFDKMLANMKAKNREHF
ncbi:MAG TPA: ABC transporter substrate-binding protein [Gammaproteobacteria bacterium]|nr:ABC transporter substrate-binding protein [Gammaproteobacteria bacterium]